MSNESPPLLPCPFCGGKAGISLSGLEAIASCDCGASTTTRLIPKSESPDACWERVTVAATAAWNRRASGKTECRVVGAAGAGRKAFEVWYTREWGIAKPGTFSWNGESYNRKGVQASWVVWQAALRGRVVGGEEVAGLRERLDAATAKTFIERDRRFIATPESCDPYAKECREIARDALALLERAAPLHEQRASPSMQPPGAGAEVVDLLTGQRYMLEEKDGVTFGRALPQHDASGARSSPPSLPLTEEKS